MKRIDTAVLALLMDYHAYHGDSHVRCADAIRLEGQPVTLYLMRFDNAQGKKYSSLDMIANGKDGTYATELWSAERHLEKEMIEFAMMRGDFSEDAEE